MNDLTHPLFSDKEIWFLTGSQSMYGDDTLRQVADQAADVIAALGLPLIIKPVREGSSIGLTKVMQASEFAAAFAAADAAARGHSGNARQARRAACAPGCPAARDGAQRYARSVAPGDARSGRSPRPMPHEG